MRIALPGRQDDGVVGMRAGADLGVRLLVIHLHIVAPSCQVHGGEATGGTSTHHHHLRRGGDTATR